MKIVRVLVLLSALVLAACGGDDGGQGQSSAVSCDPGDTKACACSSSESGTKVCGENKRWKTCQCGAAQADVVGGDTVLGFDTAAGDVPGSDGTVDPGDPCINGSQDGTETDTDCGGDCPACGAGKDCKGNGDCQSGTCTGGECVASAGCSDNAKNGGETDVDCGGPCSPCATTRFCAVHGDCLSATCIYGVCKDPTCADGVKNQGEVDTDCGGPCSLCADGKTCGGNGDCANGRCENGTCTSCQDGKKNGGEIDVDCGTAAGCDLCDLGQKCTKKEDCSSYGCEGGVCCQANACGKCTATPTEVCDGKDNDCNGSTDEYLYEGTLCPKQQGVCAGAKTACYGTQGWKCTADQYQSASYYYAETEADKCWDGYDNDCDGKTDYDDTGDCCQPQCSGKTCGDDGCGGSCGTCDASTQECIADKCQTKCGATQYTCMNRCGQQTDASGYYYCSEYYCTTYGNCAPDFASCCGSCTPSCSGKSCGDDGCGGSCGTCSDGYTCDAYGQCQYGGGSYGCGASYTQCKNCVCQYDSFCCSGWDGTCTSECQSLSACKTYCGY